MGQLDEGWREYEWRWKCRGVEEPMHNRPRWTGEPLAGRTVLLQSEQGFGDILQFIRYAELVKRQGATVIVECPPPVKSLLARCPWIDKVVTAGERLPDFDFHLPLMSLPAVFRSSLADIPATIPYLSADPIAVERWKKRTGRRSRVQDRHRLARRHEEPSRHVSFVPIGAVRAHRRHRGRQPLQSANGVRGANNWTAQLGGGGSPTWAIDWVTLPIRRPSCKTSTW